MAPRLASSILALSVLMTGATPLWGDEPDEKPPIHLSAALGYHFSTGDYGGTGSTTISFVPLTLTARRDTVAVRLTVPYIEVSGLEGLVDAGGAVVTANGSGLGDVTLDGTYTIDPWHAWMPYLDLNGRIKFPTADENDGLGTGEFDYQIEIGATQQFGLVTPFASVGYRIVGESADFALDNVWLASLGATVRVIDALDAGLFAFYQESASDTAGDQLDLMPYASWRITESWSASSYVSAGLQDGSPDFGVGVQIAYTAGF